LPLNRDLSNLDSFLRLHAFQVQKQNEDSERKMRELNANRAFWFSTIWAIFIGLVVIAHGVFPNITLFLKEEKFNNIIFLNQTEFITVIGTLTGSILTYYLLVIRYFFYRPNLSAKTISKV
jgi:hypothetical protein